MLQGSLFSCNESHPPGVVAADHFQTSPRIVLALLGIQRLVGNYMVHHMKSATASHLRQLVDDLNVCMQRLFAQFLTIVSLLPGQQGPLDAAYAPGCGVIWRWWKRIRAVVLRFRSSYQEPWPSAS